MVPSSMAVPTQADLDALDVQLATASVIRELTSTSGEVIAFRSMAEVMAYRAFLARALASAATGNTSGTRYAAMSKGC